MPRSPAAPRRVRWRSAVVVGLLVLALTPSRGATQVVGIAALGSPLDSALARARRLVNEGAGAVGRSVVDSVLAAVTPGSPDEARVLLWRAMLAESWDAAEQDYLRLMLEFDGSALAGEAMLRLAQGELARGDRPAALRYLERIVRETPTAPVRAEATVWHGRLLLEQGEAATACPLLREGRARVPRDADDLLTRYEVLLISCANLEATATTTAGIGNGDRDGPDPDGQHRADHGHTGPSGDPASRHDTRHPVSRARRGVDGPTRRLCDTRPSRRRRAAPRDEHRRCACR